MTFSKTIITVLVLVCSFSCKQIAYRYPQNREVADKNGTPKDSLTFYYSTFEPRDSSQYEFVKDTFWQNYLSANLFAFKEPVLFNDYLGKEQYRFLWLRSFHLPVVFTLVNDNGLIMLTTKKLDREPLFQDKRYSEYPEMDSAYRAMGYPVIKELDTLDRGKIEVTTVIKADRKANIIYDSTKKLAIGDWNRFKNLLEDLAFWKLKPYDWAGNTDGAMWILEANTKNRYKYLIRQSPGGKFEETGNLIIELSGLNEEIY